MAIKREIRIPTITRFAKLRPRLSVPKINLSPFGTDWSEYTSLGSVLPENTILPFQNGKLSDIFGGKLRYVLTSSPLKLLASLALTKKFDPIEKTNRIAKNQSDMVANLFFFRRLQASCVKERVGFSIFSCDSVFPAPTSLYSCFSYMILSLLQTDTWIHKTSNDICQ